MRYYLRTSLIVVPTLAFSLAGCEILGVLPATTLDAGTLAPDSGTKLEDAGGGADTDGGVLPVDGGDVPEDAGGVIDADGGALPVDGGDLPQDAGSVTPDGGMMPPPMDGGMMPPPMDGGMMPPPMDGGMPPPRDGGMPPPMDGGMPPPMDGGVAANACGQAWGQVRSLYADATQLGSCDGVPGATYVLASLMNLQGVTIDNNGVTMTPCIETRCDSTYVYVATNALPHYDFVQTTPNALKEVAYIYRLPMMTHAVGATAAAVNGADIQGCTAAYNAFISNSATTSEPSGFCGNDGYYYDILQDGSYDYHRKVPCLNTAAMLISGPPVFGPNEGPTPDPWGDPAYNWPNYAGQTVTGGAQLDLCGGHTASSMHYHAMNQACFERDVDGHPANSYVTATENWDFGALFTTDCTEESPIVGWSFDGYPIRGPCVCLQRNEDGSCAAVKRARSSWVYGGLGAWGDPATALSAEGMTCGDTTDCCQGNLASCKYKCSWSVFPDENAAGDTVADKRCVVVDYSWCTSQYVDRSDYNPSDSNFVYMDRCNGHEGPEGYSYYSTGSFPFLVGCYHGVPSDTVAGGTLGGGMMMPGDGGMMPPPMDGGMMPPPMDGGMMPPPMDGGMMPPPMDGGMMPPPMDGGMMPPPMDGGMMPPPMDGGMMPPPTDGGMMMPPACMNGQTSRCCGDNTCDGPENHSNCPADCH